MYVAMDRAAGFFLFFFVFVFYIFEFVGCGFDHVKSLFLSSVVIASLTSKQSLENLLKNSKSHVYQFAAHVIIIIYLWLLFFHVLLFFISMSVARCSTVGPMEGTAEPLEEEFRLIALLFFFLFSFPFYLLKFFYDLQQYKSIK